MENALVAASQDSSIFFQVERFEHAQRVAKMLCYSTMVPAHFQGEKNIGNVMIALNYAARLNADPFMVMQNLYVISGKPGIEAKLVIALVNQCGRFDPLEFEEKGELTEPKNDKDGMRAIAVERKSGKTLKGPWVTWGMVKAEGWYGKTGSKWKSIPALMFCYRAASYFVNTHCPEVKMGIQTRDEIVDTIDLHQQPDGVYIPATAASAITDAAQKVVEDKPKPPKSPKKGKDDTQPVQEAEKPPEGPTGGQKMDMDALRKKMTGLDAEQIYCIQDDAILSVNACTDCADPDNCASVIAWRERNNK